MSKQEAKVILEQIRNGEKYYADDYFGGESLTFGFDVEQKQFYIQRIDTIVGSYNETDFYPESIILSKLEEF